MSGFEKGNYGQWRDLPSNTILASLLGVWCFLRMCLLLF